MILQLIFLLFNVISFSSQNCVWYGECHEENGKFQNCFADNAPPQEFPPEVRNRSIEILQERCPFLLAQIPDQKFCCDSKQLDTMVKNMNYAAGLYARCPTCIANLNQHICAMTCSSNQSDFLEAVDILTDEENNSEYIMSVNFYVSKKYKEATYDSCKEVIVPSSGGKAVDMSCGIWGFAQECTPERWFEFFGNYEDNIVAPFHINYNPPPNKSFITLHINVLPCNESYESSKACSCSDCANSCEISFEIFNPEEPLVSANIIIIIILVISWLIVIGLIIRVHFNKKNRHLLNETEKSEEKNVEKLGELLKRGISNILTKWGIQCASHPVFVLALSSWIIFGLSYKITSLVITTNPTEIWASPTCTTRMHKKYFDTRFLPFYRTNQIFIKAKGLEFFEWTSPKNLTFRFGPAFNLEFLRNVYDLQMEIQNLGTEKEQGLNKICFAPMKNEFFNGDSINFCTVQSVWGYLQNDVNLLNNSNQLYDKLQKCLRNNFDPECLAPYGGPIFSSLAVGGYGKEKEIETDPDNFLLADGLILTFLINNAISEENLTEALIWEKTFIEFMKNWDLKNKPDTMEVAFSAERSIQDEIERESESEMLTVIASYIIMFIYITIALGRFRGITTFFLESKFTLGASGIVIVMASVISSLGIFGYLSVPTTLLTIEVIPFVVLAVGVDNIFILVHSYQEVEGKNEKSIEENIGIALGKVGPSILLTSMSEAACFLIGTLSEMPAVKTFAEFSSLAIIINFLLQISCFVSVLALDLKRQQKNYADIFCCFKIKNADTGKKSSKILVSFFKKFYGPFLMKTWTRILVTIIFFAVTIASSAFIFSIEKGLDQELAMPEDSYVIDYFQFMKELLSLGPPVYFVIKNGLNFTNPTEINAVCGTVGCDSDSLVSYLTRASKLSNISHIAKTPSSWIDDYLDWLYNSKECCKEFRENSSFCPHQFQDCYACEVKIKDWRPSADDFEKYLPYFLNDIPDIACPKSGRAAYAEGVNFEFNKEGNLEVKDNYFMTYHTPVKTSKDFYTALESAQKIAENLSVMLSKKINRTIEVFPYSVFYVYYEQYLNIVRDSFLSLGLSLLAIFCVTLIFTGFNIKSTILVVFVVTCYLVNMSGMLFWWNITLNAISLVNLIVSVGIGVEFCSHILHAFLTCPEANKIDKVLHALITMGTPVFSGITLTKFLGIIVLAFVQTLMLRTFYFKMYLGMVLMGAAHGLILMPVLLSYLG